MNGTMHYLPDGKVLSAGADGLLHGATPVLLPLMAPRLQGDFSPAGRVTLSLWAAGTLATVTFTPFAGPFTYGPNHVAGPRQALYVAQSRPVLVIRGVALRRLTPASRSSWWQRPDGLPPARSETRGTRRLVTLGWGTLAAEQRGDDLLLAVGLDETEALHALDLPVDTIVAQARDYIARCDRLADADPVLRSMVMHGTHAALASIRRDATGGFAGLAAGQAYSTPARTYYRDGYWTMLPLLQLAPEAVRDQIRVLATGVQPDGEAPSGVILSDDAQSRAWDEVRRTHDAYVDHKRPRDWWSDHFDSPLFFILMLGDYVTATGNFDEAQAHWKTVLAILERYLAHTGAEGLPLKPRHDRDWADNVYRGGLVSYDIGLWVGALDAIAMMGERVDAATASRARAFAKTSRAAVDAHLWVAKNGHYADYIEGSFAEDHFALDSLTLLRWRATSDAHALTTLATARAQLESRNNVSQPYGDWGVLCAFPPFKRVADTRSKTAFAYRYHNGADWPYWSAVYAEERLRRGLGDARYALTRWWEASLQSGWAGAVEYYSPPFGRGSLLQGWSGLPAHVAVTYRDQLLTRRT